MSYIRTKSSKVRDFSGSRDALCRELEIVCCGGKLQDHHKKYSISVRKAWAAIHGWDMRSASIKFCEKQKLSDADVKIAIACDFDFEMMRLCSALSGIHLDLSLIASKN